MRTFNEFSKQNIVESIAENYSMVKTKKVSRLGGFKNNNIVCKNYKNHRDVKIKRQVKNELQKDLDSDIKISKQLSLI